MKIKQITEAQYTGGPIPKGWTAEKVVATFFDLDEDSTADYHEELDEDDRFFLANGYSPKDGFRITDRRLNVDWLIRLRNGKYVCQNADAETEWQVNPSKFIVYETRPVYGT